MPFYNLLIVIFFVFWKPPFFQFVYGIFCGLMLSSLLVACTMSIFSCTHDSSICVSVSCLNFATTDGKHTSGVTILHRKNTTQLSSYFKSSFYCVFFPLLSCAFVIVVCVLFYWHISSSHWILTYFIWFNRIASIFWPKSIKNENSNKNPYGHTMPQRQRINILTPPQRFHITSHKIELWQ